MGSIPPTRGRSTDEALEIIRRLWSEESVDFAGTWHKLRGASISPRPVQRDLPMWIGGSSDAAIRRTARVGTGWIAGAELPVEAGRIAAAIRDATAAAGRTIEDDHYGVGFPFHFGRPDDPAHRLALDAFRKRTGRDPATYFAIGTAEAIFSRIAAYVDAGISKFILRPITTGDEAVLQQTRQLIEQIIPLAAATWPRG